MNNLSISEAFGDVNETHPTVGRVGRILGEFASVADGFRPNEPVLGINNNITNDMA